MSKHVYAVMGATGHIGQVLTEELLKKGHTVRALGRDIKKLEALRVKGAEIHTPAADNPTALAEVFKGADGVFTLIPPSFTEPDFLAYQNCIGEAIAKALKDSGVKHAVDLSSIGADKSSGTGPIVGLYRQEKRLEAIAGLNNLHLRAAYFMENLFYLIPIIKGMSINGTPIRPDVKIPMIATHDIGLKAAELLDSLSFTGNTVFELGGPRSLTMVEATALLGKAIGKPELPYVQFPYEDAKKAMVGSGMLANLAGLMVEMNKGFNDGLMEPTQVLTDGHQGHFPLEEFVKFIAGAYAQN